MSWGQWLMISWAIGIPVFWWVFGRHYRQITWDIDDFLIPAHKETTKMFLMIGGIIWPIAVLSVALTWIFEFIFGES